MKTKKNVRITLTAFIAFVLWTVAITKIDLQAIGPRGTVVGFATLNDAFHKMTGVHLWLYEVTDWLGLVAIVFVLGFGVLGLIQLIRRRNLFKVDSDIIILGVFYILVIIGYVVFEEFAINYRPVIIEGRLESSYPSSTTLLILCVMPTAILQLKNRIKSVVVKNIIVLVISVFTLFMVVGRTISGVHWMTDIIGGILLSISLVMLYRTLITEFKH
ncbi:MULTISPECIES: phosphatase PAP2 family protein [unclassified Clostridium]|uniref:phosphatase PAP2 family protein n=1 Tax=unclassified Clostridium TaxID=2614128 RepID=UPI00110717DF|nr:MULTISPECIES: phosphatase PAP2 family protein [unclassified Clostridium]